MTELLHLHHVRWQVRALFDDMRKRIERKSVDASYLRRSDARSLAISLVDTIMWGNYERVMDTLQVELRLLQPVVVPVLAHSLQLLCIQGIFSALLLQAGFKVHRLN